MDDERFDGEFGALFAALRDRRGTCPAPERLLALAHDEAAPAERAALQAHVHLCPSCASELDRLVAAPAAVDEVSWRRVERRFDRRAVPWNRRRELAPRRRAFAWLGVAAALVLAVGFVLRVGWGRDKLPPDAVSATRGEAIQVLEPAGRVHAVARFEWFAPPVEAIYLVELRRGSELVWRGETTESFLAAPGELGRLLEPGVGYRWRVQAVDTARRAFLASEWTELELVP